MGMGSRKGGRKEENDRGSQRRSKMDECSGESKLEVKTSEERVK